MFFQVSKTQYNFVRTSNPTFSLQDYQSGVQHQSIDNLFLNNPVSMTLSLIYETHVQGLFYFAQNITQFRSNYLFCIRPNYLYNSENVAYALNGYSLTVNRSVLRPKLHGRLTRSITEISDNSAFTLYNQIINSQIEELTSRRNQLNGLLLNIAT